MLFTATLANKRSTGNVLVCFMGPVSLNSVSFRFGKKNTATNLDIS